MSKLYIKFVTLSRSVAVDAFLDANITLSMLYSPVLKKKKMSLFAVVGELGGQFLFSFPNKVGNDFLMNIPEQIFVIRKYILTINNATLEFVLLETTSKNFFSSFRSFFPFWKSDLNLLNFHALYVIVNILQTFYKMNCHLYCVA